MNLKQIFNKYKNLKSYFHRKIICSGYPEVFNIELTNACIMSCIMCPRRFMKRQVGFIKFDLFKKIINQLDGYSCAVWLHHFGESLLHPKLKQMIAYAKSKGIKTQLSINPVLLNEKNIEKIKNLDYLHISLDGSNEKTYQKLRGKNANYKQAIIYIKHFLKLKHRPKTTIAIIRLKETEQELEEFKQQWKGFDIEIKDFTTWDGSQSSITSLASKFSEAYKKNLSYPCLRPWHRFTILWDGKVVPCCYDYDGKYILGDLETQTLEEIWNSSATLELRKQHITNNFSDNLLCKNCKEKYGLQKSYFYPFNIAFLKRVFVYSKQKLK